MMLALFLTSALHNRSVTLVIVLAIPTQVWVRAGQTMHTDNEASVHVSSMALA